MKYFKESIKALRKFAKCRGIKVRIIEKCKKAEEELYVAYYDQVDRKIVVIKSHCRSQWSLVCFLAHEIGHDIDLLILSKKEQKKSNKFLYKWYDAVEGELPIKKEVHQSIIDRETAAWNYGFKLMKDLHIIVSKKRCNKIMKQGLDAYNTYYVASVKKK